MPKIIMAMSGGVDSSVAALMLKNKGFDVTGIMLKMFDRQPECDSIQKKCCSAKDAADARDVAAQIDIPFYVINYTKYFKEFVMAKFVESYQRGETPNPCIECNQRIKFGKLLEEAKAMDMDFVASGHYAQIVFDGSRYLLTKAMDRSKDQSYVLYGLTQQQLSRILFPLGDMTKEKVRKFATDNFYKNANKPDSQDICFVSGHYSKFIEEYTGTKANPGNFLDIHNNIIGKHNGHVHYTIGQRRRLNVNYPKRLFVKAKNPMDNSVTLATEDKLFLKRLKANNLNLIVTERLDSPLKIKAKVRYGADEQPAILTQTGISEAIVEFDFPQRAITPGQAVVFYDGNIVVGGGVITADL